MSDGTGGKEERERSSSTEAALSARLRHLGERLDRYRAKPRGGHTSAPAPAAEASGLARGLQLSSELVAGVLVGAVIGWLIDRWLESSPLGLIVFLLLGFAAGLLNVMRAAGIMRAPGNHGA